MVTVLLAAYFVWTIAAYVAMVAASIGFYRRRVEDEAAPLTVIKPMKGAEDELEAKLRSLLESDPTGRTQVVFAIEAADDPAYAIASRLASEFAGRDVSVLLTGPSGERMGKVHNMIEALPKARHERVVFSDADVIASPALLAETSRAFSEGCDAVYATPYVLRVRSLAEGLFGYAFNHGFCSVSAGLYRLGVMRNYAGAWMGFTRPGLARLGGLEPFARVPADDFALGEAARRAGLRIGLLRVIAELQETTSGLPDAFAHFYKWGVVIRGAEPRVVWAFLLHAGLLAAFGASAVSAAAQGTPWPAALYVAGAAVRVAGPLLQDLAVIGRPLPLWLYPLIPIFDLGQFPFWVATLATRRFLWRGKTYRLAGTGRLEVVA